MRRRVVITGLGAVSALGTGADEFWSGLCEARTGLGPIEAFDPGGFSCQIGGEVTGLSAKDYVPKSYRKAIKVMARDIELAVACAQLAVEQAGLVTRGSAQSSKSAVPEDGFALSGERLGCQIGAGLIAAEQNELARAFATSVDGEGATATFSYEQWGGGPGGGSGMDNLQPLWMLKYLPNMLACHVTIVHGAEGPSNTITCSEASGLLSLGESARVIERGDADACFTGGCESKVTHLGMMRLTVTGRLREAAAGDDPATMILPYDKDAPGTVIGEGGAIMIAEAAEHAEARGAKIIAEVAGFGAAHATGAVFPGVVDPAPPFGEPDNGVRRAVKAALRDAGIGLEEVDAIVPAATGIAASDAGELGALTEVFGDRLSEIPMLTITPAVGQCSAGQGALMAVAAAQAIASQTLPGRIHTGSPDPRAQAGPAETTDARLENVLVCTSSFGGQSAAIVLRRYAS